MELTVGKIITFTNDKEYIIVATATYDDFDYYALINQNDLTDAIICFFEAEAGQQKLNVVTDEELIKDLIPLLYESTDPNNKTE